MPRGYRLLKSLARTDFVLLGASWKVETALRLLAQHQGFTCIIERTGAKPGFYVLAWEELGQALQGKALSLDLESALALWESRADAVFPGSTPFREVEALLQSSKRALVIRDGYRIAGYINAAAVFGTQAGDAPTPPPPPLAPLTNYLAMATFPQTIKVASEHTLVVTVSRNSVSFGPGGAALALPSLAEGTDVEVVVEPSAHFDPPLPDRQRIQYPTGGNTQATFVLKSRAEGLASLKVRFYPGELSPLLMGPIEVQVVGEGVEISARDAQEHTHSLGADPVAYQKPDLEIRIRQQGQDLIFEASSLSAPQTAELGRICIRGEPKLVFAEKFRAIHHLPISSDTARKTAETSLKTIGMSLFEHLIPPALQSLLLTNRERIKFILIQSEEPYIPWEFCYLFGEVGGQYREVGFLCEEFNVTRWREVEGRLQGMSQQLSLSNIAVIAPADTNLSYGSKERDYFMARADPAKGCSVTPITPQPTEVRDALFSGKYDVIHFVGHGYVDPSNADPGRAEIELEDGAKFTPDFVTGDKKSFGKTRPVVFLNACQTGLASIGLTDIGGWADSFIENGAGAFIGTLWPVEDQFAHQFCEAFYEGLWANKTIAEAARDARKAIKDQGTKTWLAYTVFAHPLARLV